MVGVGVEDEVGPFLRPEVCVEVAEAGEAHVGLVALPERRRRHGHLVRRAAAVWQTPRPDVIKLFASVIYEFSF